MTAADKTISSCYSSILIICSILTTSQPQTCKPDALITPTDMQTTAPGKLWVKPSPASTAVDACKHTDRYNLQCCCCYYYYYTTTTILNSCLQSWFQDQYWCTFTCQTRTHYFYWRTVSHISFSFWKVFVQINKNSFKHLMEWHIKLQV